MPLRSPNLDDRRFEDLVEEARRRIVQVCPEWTDLTPGDPGVVLLEVFAYLTDAMLYRLNRVPDKAKVEFLRLIGVTLQPPAAAAVSLKFSLARPRSAPLEIAQGTRVTTARADGAAEPPIFVTTQPAVIPAGAAAVDVPARHCELVEAELAGRGTGLPGLHLDLARPPIIAPTGDELDLVVGVEATAEELAGGNAPALKYADKAFRIWREVENFSNLGAQRHVYVADRLAGSIDFAPALRMQGSDGRLPAVPEALAEVPAAGREIRVWYRRGGGVEGNVTAGLLTTLKDPIPGLEVSNPQPAAGGRAAEELANALLRGPQELHSLHRAVTARDFELLALRSSGAVDRAHAFTKAMLWEHAPPGTVEVLLVPHIPAAQRPQGQVTPEQLVAQRSDAALQQIRQALERRKPLGTTCLVNWARIKPVQVRAQVLVRREENPEAVQQRVLQRLWQTINPLPLTPQGKGWPFGKALTAWDIYRIIGEEPGVSSVSRVRMQVEEVPDQDVRSLCADAFQPHTWYAGAGDAVFRTGNDGEGWECVNRFADERVVCVKSFPKEAGTRRQPGLLAVATQLTGGAAKSALHISRDCGESWEVGLRTTFPVVDMAWLERDEVPVLLLATDKGLYELAIHEGAEPHQIAVDAANLSLGFFAVAVLSDLWGGTSVAVSGQGEKGIYLSTEGGRPGTFTHIGLKGELVRVLAFQHRGPQRYLWAGTAAIGNDPGKGCFRWRLTGEEKNPEGWVAFATGWDAGGCRALTCQGPRVFAGSLRRGVLRLDTSAASPSWAAPAITCNLPLRGTERLFHPVDAVAADAGDGLLLAGGLQGIYRSADLGDHYSHISSPEFSERVTLPRTWLFCSGEHAIEVSGEDESGRD